MSTPTRNDSKNRDNHHFQKPHWIIAVAGISSGFTTALFTAPLDLLRTESMALRSSRSNMERVQMIMKTEGATGLWKGFSLSVLGLVPTWAVYWTTYNLFKQFQKDKLGRKEGAFTHLLAAMAAGICTTVSMNPIWVIKTRIQTQNLTHYVSQSSHKSAVGTAISIFRKEGIYGFFRGIIPSLLGVTHVCVQFPLYEYLKLTLSERRNQPAGQLSLGDLLIASTVSKVAASCAAYPHEVLRVRQQAARRSDRLSLLDLARRTYLEEGIRGFYRGIGVNLLRVVPAAAITFSTYEYASNALFEWSRRR